MAVTAESAAGDLRALLAQWGRLWGTPGLEDAVALAFSTRLRRSLGRCRPASGKITLQASLRDAPRGRLEEVLCHEAAHVAEQPPFGAARVHGHP